MDQGGICEMEIQMSRIEDDKDKVIIIQTMHTPSFDTLIHPSIDQSVSLSAQTL